MSKIEDLIKQYCPNGVEYDVIENICKISRGRVMSKEYLRDNIGEYPVYSSQTINEGMLGKIDTYDYDGTEKKLEETLTKINNEIQEFLNVIDEEVDQINDYMMDNIEKLIDENSK